MSDATPLVLALLLAGCAAAGTQSMGKIRDVPPKLIVSSEVIDAGGKLLGPVTASQEADGVRIHAVLAGLPVGVHGVHLHAVGRCESPGFTTAGGHFNPGLKQHGSMNPAGEHDGDLPNITVGDDRRATYDAFRKGLRLADGPTPLLGPGGAALVVHAGPDDYRTDPAGNAGARIACGVIARGPARTG